MKTLNRDDLLNIVTKSYFGNVDLKKIDQVLECFTENAILTVRTDNLSHKGRNQDIQRMFTDFFKSFFVIWHGDFDPIIDEENQSVVIRFNALRLRFDGVEERAQNVNIFRFTDGKFSEIEIYMSDENPLK
tara:strand:- start:374 stop:766 length:393 start_codon:yes stop_codon:yes gene_type:complete